MDAQQSTMEVSVNVQDIYSWRATYSDGSHLDEEHAVGGFASVDQQRCAALTLLYMGSIPVHTVNIPAGATPVFFRRRRVSVNVVSEASEQQPTVHCIGWKRSENDAVYLFVDEHGNTVLSNDLQAG